MFFFKTKKSVNKKNELYENSDVLKMINDLNETKRILQTNISWWYNGADKESLKRQLTYRTGQLRRMENFVDRFNEVISVLQENIYVEDINNIKYDESVFYSLKRNKDLIKWCERKNKNVDDDFRKYSLIHDMFCGDSAIADLILSKEHWNHSGKWQTKWILEVNYYSWSNEKFAEEANGEIIVDYKCNVINSLHAEAIIYDSLKYSGAKLNNTNSKKFINVALQINDLKNAEVAIKNELGKYNVLLENKIITSYVKEKNALEFKENIELIIKYLKGWC